MSYITVNCLVKGDNPCNGAFCVDIDTNKIKNIGQLKDVIKDKKMLQIRTDQFKHWKVKIPIKEKNPNLLDKFHDEINIKQELEGMELSPRSKITDYFSGDFFDEYIQIIIEPCTFAIDIDTDTLSQRVSELERRLSTLEKVIRPINYLQLASNYGIIKEGSSIQYGTIIVKASVGENKRAILFHGDKHYDSFYKFIFAIDGEVCAVTFCYLES